MNAGRLLEIEQAAYDRFSDGSVKRNGNGRRPYPLQNRLALTGHMMEEPTLQSQTAALGETMRSYRSFHIPGIDMLCDWRELTTASNRRKLGV